MQRAGDGSGGECEDVDFLAHLLEPLLVGDAEALLFIDDDEAEVLEVDIALEEAMGADDDIHGAIGERGDGRALLAVRAEAREHVDAHGEAGEPFSKGVQVLLSEDRGGHEDGDLSPVHDGLERGAEGNLCLAVADIAADEAVHGAWSLHVCLHVTYGAELVGRLHIGEGGFHLLLPGRVGREGASL